MRRSSDSDPTPITNRRGDRVAPPPAAEDCYLPGNSANNKSNPNPNRTVYYGTMTWEEMMNSFYSVVVDQNVDPAGQIIRAGRTVA